MAARGLIFPPGSLHIGDDGLLYVSLSHWGLFPLHQSLDENFMKFFSWTVARI